MAPAWRGGLWLLFWVPAILPAAGADRPRPGELFPPAPAFKQGYLQVSELHRIAYSLHGNPAGQPVLVLHGGPGFGCYPRLTRYFDPTRFLIVLHDQRGAGRSLPPGELRENTTQHLVGDIERLRAHLGIEGPTLVFGGSWGSTLALAYGEAHPEQVSGMILRGIWTGTKAELDNGYAGELVNHFFPQAVADVRAALPPEHGEFEPRALLRVFNGPDDRLARDLAAAWIRYGVKVGKLHATDAEVAAGFGELDPLPGARIDCHYAAHGFFLEEGQLLRNAPRLREIPVVIINGRYDMLCPPITAWRLHKALPRSRLVLVEEAGHSEGEPGITRALVEAVAAFDGDRRRQPSR